MQGIIPAAGEGTRLRRLTDHRPKGLVPVDGRPLLTHVFESARTIGVEELIVVVGYRGERIVDRYGDGFRDLPITYVEQSRPLGLGHAVGLAATAVEFGRAEPVAILNGDNVVRGNLGDAVDRAMEPRVDGALLVEPVDPDVARRTGVVETDEDGRVTGMVEKADDPPSRLASAGFVVVRPELVSICRDLPPGRRGEYELSDALDRFVARGRRLVTVPLDGWRVNVNTPADRDRAARRLAERPG